MSTVDRMTFFAFLNNKGPNALLVLLIRLHATQHGGGQRIGGEKDDSPRRDEASPAAQKHDGVDLHGQESQPLLHLHTEHYPGKQR